MKEDNPWVKTRPGAALQKIISFTLRSSNLLYCDKVCPFWGWTLLKWNVKEKATGLLWLVIYKEQNPVLKRLTL